MNKLVVSAATAQQLKAAGFSIPDPAIGQIWYSTFDTEFEITGTSTMEKGEFILSAENERPHNVEPINLKDGYTFAPTASDIKEVIKSTGAATAHLPDDPEECAEYWLVTNTP